MAEYFQHLVAEIVDENDGKVEEGIAAQIGRMERHRIVRLAVVSGHRAGLFMLRMCDWVEKLGIVSIRPRSCSQPSM